MAKYCGKCGTYLEDNAKVCKKCGTVLDHTGKKKVFDFKSKIFFWENSKLATEEVKKLIIFKALGGIGYLFIFLVIWIPWLSIKVYSHKVSYSYGDILDEMMNDRMLGLLLTFTIIFILISILFFVLSFARLSIACIIISWLPKLLVLFMCATEFSDYHYSPSYGMILEFIGFAMVAYTASKSKKILQGI